MTKGLLYCAVTIALISQPASAAERSCLPTISELRDATDCQTTEAIHDLVWPEAGELYDLVMTGPCPKYRTFLREARPGPVIGNRQIIAIKAIVTMVTGILGEEQYTGDYSVLKLRYVCERRRDEWRILSREVLSRVDGVNEAAARRFESSGGWAGPTSN